MSWLRGAVAVVALSGFGCTSALPAESSHPAVQGRARRVCASEGFSCVPGPCCRGLKCVDEVCKKPSK